MVRKLKSMDGNTAAAHVSYAFTEVAAIYPITPSSPMADYVDQWSAEGRKNMFGTTVKVAELAVRSRRRRQRARLSQRRCADHHLHRLSGPAADDPQHVQDRRRAAALRVPRFRPCGRVPRAEHFRRPRRRVRLPSDRLRHAGGDQHSGDHGPLPGGAPVRHPGPRSRSSTSSTASAPLTRSRRSPSGITMI